MVGRRVAARRRRVRHYRRVDDGVIVMALSASQTALVTAWRALAQNGTQWDTDFNNEIAHSPATPSDQNVIRSCEVAYAKNFGLRKVFIGQGTQ
jgi:hypothetical protein